MQNSLIQILNINFKSIKLSFLFFYKIHSNYNMSIFPALKIKGNESSIVKRQSKPIFKRIEKTYTYNIDKLLEEKKYNESEKKELDKIDTEYSLFKEKSTEELRILKEENDKANLNLQKGFEVFENNFNYIQQKMDNSESLLQNNLVKQFHTLLFAILKSIVSGFIINEELKSSIEDTSNLIDKLHSNQNDVVLNKRISLSLQRIHKLNSFNEKDIKCDVDII